MVWYSSLLKNFPQFIVIHTVKGFGIVNKIEVDIFLELSCRSCLYIFEISCFLVAPREKTPTGTAARGNT